MIPDISIELRIYQGKMYRFDIIDNEASTQREPCVPAHFTPEQKKEVRKFLLEYIRENL